MGYRDHVREMALLNVLERGDGPETHPTSAHAKPEFIPDECLNGCGPIDYGEWCPRCEEEL